MYQSVYDVLPLLSHKQRHGIKVYLKRRKEAFPEQRERDFYDKNNQQSDLTDCRQKGPEHHRSSSSFCTSVSTNKQRRNMGMKTERKSKNRKETKKHAARCRS